jgi:hypothetical protein
MLSYNMSDGTPPIKGPNIVYRRNSSQKRLRSECVVQYMGALLCVTVGGLRLISVAHRSSHVNSHDGVPETSVDSFGI